MHTVCMCRANVMRMRTIAPIVKIVVHNYYHNYTMQRFGLIKDYTLICTSLCVVVECTCRRIIRIAPFWEPVISYEVAAAWKHLLKHLAIVVGFFIMGNDTTEL